MRVYIGVELVEASNTDGLKGSASHGIAEAGEWLRVYAGVETVELVELIHRVWVTNEKQGRWLGLRCLVQLPLFL